MNILSKLLGNKTKAEKPLDMINNLPNTVEEIKTDNIPPIDLFIDNEPPQPEKQVVIETHPNKITGFLNRNYFSMGVNDGYEYHSQETLEIGKKKIKSEFQFILDQSIQEKLQKRLQIKNLIVHIAQIAETTKQTLENTIEEINSSLRILQNQKELSAENEGWVMNAIHSYHQGFIQGLNDYITGEDMLNSIKNI